MSTSTVAPSDNDRWKGETVAHHSLFDCCEYFHLRVYVRQGLVLRRPHQAPAHEGTGHHERRYEAEADDSLRMLHPPKVRGGGLGVS